MDPASIFALVEGSAGLALKCLSVAKSLNDLASKYKQSKLTILSMVQNLDTMRLVWGRIGKWSQDYVENNADQGHASSVDDNELFNRLERSLEIGDLIMGALEEDIQPYTTRIEKLGVGGRARLVWNETILRAHEDRLGHQAQAMTMLLQILQLELSSSRSSSLRRSSQVFLKSDESAYSIVPSCMSSRYSTSTIQDSRIEESEAMEYRYLSFEDSLFTARVYKRNYRTGLIDQLFKSRSSKTLRRGIQRSSQILDSPGDIARRNLLENQAVEDRVREASLTETSMIRLQPDWLDVEIYFDEADLKGVSRLQNYVRKGTPLKRDEDQYLYLRDIIRHTFYDSEAELPSRSSHSWTGVDGLSVLRHALYRRDTDVIKEILKIYRGPYSGAVLVELEGQLLFETQTQYLRPHNSLELIARLVEAGTDVNCVNDAGFQPLHLLSMRENDYEVFKLLIEQGADIEARVSVLAWEKLTPKRQASLCPVKNFSPLQIACYCGRVSNTVILLRLGATLDAAYDPQKHPIILALQSGDQQTIVSIVAYVQPVIPRHSSISYRSVGLETLAMQVYNGCKALEEDQIVSFVDKVLMCTSDHNSIVDHNPRLTKIYHLLAKCKTLSKEAYLCDLILKLLSATSANIDKPDGAGHTPLSIAAHELHYVTVKLFLEHGAKLPITFTMASVTSYTGNDADETLYNRMRFLLRQHSCLNNTSDDVSVLGLRQGDSNHAIPLEDFQQATSSQHSQELQVLDIHIHIPDFDADQVCGTGMREVPKKSES